MSCWLCHGTRVRVRVERRYTNGCRISYIPCECAPESARSPEIPGKIPIPRQNPAEPAELPGTPQEPAKSL